MQHSMRDQVNACLTEYADLIKKYFAFLSTAADHVTLDEANNPEHIIKEIVALEDKLQKSVEQIEEHQKRQQKIIQVQDEIHQYNKTLLNLVQKLNTSRNELDQHLSTNIQFTDILSYASKLSKYTSAPPNFDVLNRDMKMDFEKPYPDEERMRRGLLYWQNSSQPHTEERFESSDSEMSATEDTTEQNANRQNEDTGGDPFWILDLNPDMQS
ncbi:hypothetical protein RMCBS344292_07049 [Rhizopus microsporus]|nr:hypothetical protein RMCBS344292_07049 [Rhizopus microsporus]